MKAKVILMFVFAINFLGSAQYVSSAMKSMKDADTLFVQVAEIPEKVKEYGISVEEIKTITEQKIQDAGITVVADTLGLVLPGSANLFVNPNIFVHDAGFFVFNLRVEFRQEVSAKLIPDLTIFNVPTWETTYLATIGADQEGVATIYNILSDMLDKFTKDWKAVNKSE